MAAMPGAETFRSSADAYDRFVGRYGPSLASALIGFAGVEPGTRALDVGCGPGALSAALVDRLGAASVSAADPSAPFVDACQARLPDIDVVEASAEALPFADESFDAVVSTFGVMFTPNQEKSASEMSRVTRKGGRIGMANWTPESYIGQLFKIIGKHLPPPAGGKRDFVRRALRVRSGPLR